MSKIGEKPIEIPNSVVVEVNQNQVEVKGTEGEYAISLPPILRAQKGERKINITRADDEKKTKSLHGLFRQLVQNIIIGMQRPWQKRLEVIGTGFNVRLQGEDLVFKLGFSHPVVFKKVAGIKFQIEGNNKVIVIGVDKQLVGQVAYQIKTLKKPDIYKGKGIRYEGEKIRIKPGKKVKATETAGAS